jgi:hypothetical protein
MIRYLISADALKKLVKTASATWLNRAKELTAKAVQAGKVEAGLAIWSEIKPVFLRIQGNKCIYCERLLPGEELGLVEHDVEHYRPKNRVQPWPAQKDLDALGLTAYPFATGTAAPGYVSLAFDISNYAAACKTCNSSLKSDRFPIAGTRASAPLTAAKLKAEKPYLPLPLGSNDADPEKLIGFTGILPFPLDPDPDSFTHRRARVTIDFFRLASPTRESDLLQPRLTGCALYAAKFKERTAATTAAERTRLDKVLAALTAPTRPHSSCVRAYARLCKDSPAKAKEMATLFDTLLERGVRELFLQP